MEFRRRLYKRGSSFETTIPMPLLLAIDSSSQQDVVFSYDQEKQAWYIQFQPRFDSANASRKNAEHNSRASNAPDARKTSRNAQ